MLNRLYDLGYKLDDDRYDENRFISMNIMFDNFDFDKYITDHANELIDEYLSRIVYNTISIKYSLLEKSNKLYKYIMDKYYLLFDNYLMIRLGLRAYFRYMVLGMEIKGLKIKLLREACANA